MTPAATMVKKISVTAEKLVRAIWKAGRFRGSTDVILTPVFEGAQNQHTLGLLVRFLTSLTKVRYEKTKVSTFQQIQIHFDNFSTCKGQIIKTGRNPGFGQIINIKALSMAHYIYIFYIYKFKIFIVLYNLNWCSY